MEHCESSKSALRPTAHFESRAERCGFNELVVRRADEPGLVERWFGLRVVAGDAPVLMPTARPCLLERSSAAPNQRLFAQYLPGAELTLYASVHSPSVAERNMRMEALDVLGLNDGYLR